MKNLVMLVTGLLLAAPQLSAANGRVKAVHAKDSVKVKEGRNKSADARAEQHTKWIDKKVQLTAEQRKQVYDVNLEIAKKVDELKANKNGDRKQMKDKRMALEEERDAKLKSILTQVQWDKYVAAKKEKKEEMKEKKEKNKAGKGKKKGHKKPADE